MKKYFLLLTAILLISAGCQQNDQTLQVTNQAGTSIVEQPEHITAPIAEQGVFGYETATINDEQDAYYYDLEYPVFTGGSDGAAEKINTEMSDFVQEELRLFLEDFANEDHVSDPGPWSLYIDYEVKRNDLAFVSLVLKMEVYTGGAHPGSYTETFNFNLEEGASLMALDEVFNPAARVVNPATGVEQDYIEYISEETINELIAREIGDEQGIRAGAGPDETNYEHFYLTNEDVGFIFDPYTVAPGAAGPQEITISFEDLADFLKAYDF